MGIRLSCTSSQEGWLGPASFRETLLLYDHQLPEAFNVKPTKVTNTSTIIIMGMFFLNWFMVVKMWLFFNEENRFEQD